MQAIPQRGVGLEEALAVFMQLGDLCEIEISGIGISRNSIATEPRKTRGDPFIIRGPRRVFSSIIADAICSR
jgi:hypothetical protein